VVEPPAAAEPSAPVEDDVGVPLTAAGTEPDVLLLEAVASPGRLRPHPAAPTTSAIAMTATATTSTVDLDLDLMLVV
jgi:hypothetical protein